MKRPTRKRTLASRKRLKRRLVLVSMVFSSGVVGVLYLFGGARERPGGPATIQRDHGGDGFGFSVTRLVGGIAGHVGGENGAQREVGGESQMTTERILASGYCSGEVSNGGMAVLYVTGVIYCFLGLAIVCDEFFQTSLETISEVLGLTPDVAGATFLAAGSSAPELFTSLADAFGHANSTGTGTIVGSAMFNILVIVALSAAVAGNGGGSIRIDWRPVCRDVLFYSYSIAILALVFLDSEVQWWEGLIMFLSYIIYIVFMKYNSRILAHCQPAKIGITDEHQVAAADMDAAVAAVTKQPSLGGGEDTAKVAPLPNDDVATAEAGGAEPGEGEGAAEGGTGSPRKSSMLGIRNRVERRLSNGSSVDESKPLVSADQNQATADEENGGAAGQVTAAAVADTGTEKADGGGAAGSGEDGKKGEETNEEEEEEVESRFAWPDKLIDQVSFVIGLPILVSLSFTIPDCGNPKYRKYYVISFLMSLLWIGALTHYMVVWVTAVGCFLEVSPIFMGLVVLAIGTSVPDALGSMIAARGGEANMAIANAVGSNVFDILIGLGFPWFLRGLVKSVPMPVDREGIALNVIILFCTAILFVTVLILNDWTMNTRTGVFLFLVYIAYVIFVVIRELIL